MSTVKNLNISLNKELNDELNEKMKKHGISRTAYISMALKNQFRMEQLQDNLPEVLKAMQDLNKKDQVSEADKEKLRQIAMFDEKK